ncbi:MAG: hypothetical protein PWQ57_3350 [Desulfovibrionales bacterium]|nr:hypothetical protein [Desulfovibrionales bacterium]
MDGWRPWFRSIAPASRSGGGRRRIGPSPGFQGRLPERAQPPTCICPIRRAGEPSNALGKRLIWAIRRRRAVRRPAGRSSGRYDTAAYIIVFIIKDVILEKKLHEKRWKVHQLFNGGEFLHFCSLGRGRAGPSWTACPPAYSGAPLGQQLPGAGTVAESYATGSAIYSIGVSRCGRGLAGRPLGNRVRRCR